MSSNRRAESSYDIKDEEERGQVPRNNGLTIPPPSEWLNRYNRLLDRYPLRTKMCTSFVVSAIGSSLGSYLSNSAKHERAKSRSEQHPGGTCEGKTQINWVDVISFAIHGGLINAPISHYWFEWLSVNGPSSNTASVLVDQLVVQPPLLARKFRHLQMTLFVINCTTILFRRVNHLTESLALWSSNYHSNVYLS